ncbi:MAG: hypothetical protein ACM3PU_16595 [Gemmatimonadota bacterium]
MNSTTLIDDVQIQVNATMDLPKEEVNELRVVELAYVGGGMANVAFM